MSCKTCKNNIGRSWMWKTEKYLCKIMNQIKDANDTCSLDTTDKEECDEVKENKEVK